MKPTKTPAQVAASVYATIKKSGTDARAVLRALRWHIETTGPLSSPEALLSVTGHTKPVQLGGRTAWPSETGLSEYLYNRSDNEPAQKNGVFRFAVGRSLESKPVLAFERTQWIVARRAGDVPAPFNNFQRIFSHGRDFELVSVGDAANTLTLFHPDPQPDDMGFGVIRVDGVSFSTSFESYILRFKSDTVCLSVSGKDYSFAIKGGGTPTAKPARWGAGGDYSFATSNMEVTHMGFADRYLSDDDVRLLETSLKL